MNAFELTMSQVGYKPVTTFWTDFTIADRFGIAAVKDTFNRAFAEWKSNIKYLTELVMVLNHKLWWHYDNDNMRLAHVYDDLWRYADDWCHENLQGEDKRYYCRTTD